MRENKQAFVIDETIHFMKNNEPSSGKITGIITYEGHCRGIYGEKLAPKDGKITEYCVGGFDTINRTKSFATKKALMNSLFSDEKEESLKPGEQEV